ncbi:MAG: translational GTPase TypA [Porphyromonas sp.]|nr:translational GTPase TypA [Bacteroidales bacterium]MDD7559285.1 translational GTPase TypA [Bacteroidales bacterium]MDY3101429.1 translational GTPase TypA [Porphyromonas sp.]
MQNIRNIAIIAHVDHGKTSLVDRMLEAGKLFRDPSEMPDQVLDSNDLERERGITIVSKNVSINYKGTKINIIDTPGHADFGGEVERVLNMADGCLLLVDAFEGPMPQTRFVLGKAIEIGLKPIVVINKVDKENCRPDEVQEQVFDLMFNLDATEDQLDFPTIFGSAKQGWMSKDGWTEPKSDITDLLDAIIEYIPEPKYVEGPSQMLITSLDYSSYVGRIAIGRVHRGTLKEGENLVLIKRDGTQVSSKIRELNVFEGMGRKKVSEVPCGDICAVIGLENFEIGETIADSSAPEALPTIAVDEPTMSMLFTINNSPFFGREGKYVTSRHIHDRLMKELDKNLALRVEATESADSWNVFGRGVLHLSVLIETMRREGYELQVGQPQVIIKEINGQKCEPVEELTISVPEESSSKIIDIVTKRKGEMTMMETKNDRVIVQFKIPSRGIIGLNNQALTASSGEAIVAHRFLDFEPWKGDLPGRSNGSIVTLESGQAYAYALNNLQSRGRFFIEPGDEVYEGQIVGEHTKDKDLPVNVTKSKKLTNMRASGSDDKVSLAPATKFSLEDALEWIKSDEYVEVTPKSMRLRKILLSDLDRKRAER